MRLFRSARWLLLAALLSVIPASLHAQVSISVGFAPPMLPVYEQPYCPEPNLMWIPGYWAWGDGDYYWVPGTWVAAPYEGALWTPHWWGWDRGHYRFHRGYWGRHVGYYGGVDYGYGYGGFGFSGGEWRGHEFAYNTAVMRVNEGAIHNTYNDRTIVERNTIVNNNHVSYNGGPGGIQYAARPQEQVAAREQHVASTSVQSKHAAAAQADRTSYAKVNGGHPQHVVTERPLGVQNNAAPAGMRQGQATQQSRQLAQQGRHTQQQAQTQQRQQAQQKQAEQKQKQTQTQQRQQSQQKQAEQKQAQTRERQQGQQKQAEQKQAQTQQRQQAQQKQAEQNKAQTQQRQQTQQKQAEQKQAQTQQRQQAQQKQAEQQQAQTQQRQQAPRQPQPQSRPAPQQHSAPPSKEESKPKGE